MAKEALERLVGYQSRTELLESYLEGKTKTPEEAATVQKLVEGFLDRHLKVEEINNPLVYLPYVQTLSNADESRAKGLFEEKKDEIVAGLRADDKSKLAKLALEVLTPAEIEGDEAHNETARAHNNYLQVSKLSERVEKGERVSYNEILEVVKPIVEQDIDLRLSEEANPDNKYLPEDVKKNVKAAAVNGFVRTSIAREYLDVAVNNAMRILLVRFPQGENDFVEYAEKTLKHMDEGEARRAIKKIYTAKIKE